MRLAGFLFPWKPAPCFLIPYFTEPGANHAYVQNVNNWYNVIEFCVYDTEFHSSVLCPRHLSNADLEIGMPAIMAATTDAVNIICGTAQYVRSKLMESDLASLPDFFKIEALRFVRDDPAVISAAIEDASRLLKSDNLWRRSQSKASKKFKGAFDSVSKKQWQMLADVMNNYHMIDGEEYFWFSRLMVDEHLDEMEKKLRGNGYIGGDIKYFKYYDIWLRGGVDTQILYDSKFFKRDDYLERAVYNKRSERSVDEFNVNWAGTFVDISHDDTVEKMLTWFYDRYREYVYTVDDDREFRGHVDESFEATYLNLDDEYNFADVISPAKIFYENFPSADPNDIEVASQVVIRKCPYWIERED